MTENRKLPRVDKTRKRRKSKSDEIIELLTLVHSPEDSSEIFRADMTRNFVPPAVMGPAEKLIEISSAISSKLEKISSDSKSNLDPGASQDLGAAREKTGSKNETVSAKLSRLEQEFQGNQRIISALTAHLVEHLIVGADIVDQANDLRLQAEAELNKDEAYVRAFVKRLLAVGVTQNHIQNMSRDRFSMVAKMIIGDLEKELSENFDKIPMFDDGYEVTPLTKDETVEKSTENVGISPDHEVGSNTEMDAPDQAVSDSEMVRNFDDIAPVKSHEDSSSESHEEMARRLNLPVITDLNYRYIERLVSTDRDAEALHYTLPVKMKNLFDLFVSGPERHMIQAAYDRMDLEEFKKLMSRWILQNDTPMCHEEVMIWAFFLMAIPYQRRARTWKPGTFHGIIFPLPDGSKDRVVQIVSTDPKEVIEGNWYREVDEN